MTAPATRAVPAPDRRADKPFAALLLGSFRRLVGRPLIEMADGEHATAAWLYAEAPFCLLAHDGATDPRFTYANLAAQGCFGYDWEGFVGLPSRLSAAADAHDERRRALETVSRHGFVDGYSGVRVTRSGHRFRISEATIWNLDDAGGRRHGQAALIRRWCDAE